MRVFLVGDVGAVDGVFHLGDEAMLEAFVSELRERGIEEFTVMSAAPEDSAGRYRVEGMPTFGFSSDEYAIEDARIARIDAIEAAALGETGALDWQDPAWRIIEAVASSDVVAISGGGNLNSLWPAHIAERATLGRLAQAFSKPLLITGQGLGPYLTGPDGTILARLLKSAEVVGLRDAESVELAIRLGVGQSTITQTIDDAAFLHSRSAAGPIEDHSYCVVSFAPWTGAIPIELAIDALTELVDLIVDETDLDVYLLPHVGDLAGRTLVGDAAFHDAIVSRSSRRARLRSLPTASSLDAIEIMKGASLAVSSRYHGVVFATAYSVPAIAISVDSYTDDKHRGAMSNAGLPDAVVPLWALPSGGAREVIRTVWRRRTRIRRHLDQVMKGREASAKQWWDHLAAIVRGEQSDAPVWLDAEEFAVIPPQVRLANDSLAGWMRGAADQTVGNDLTTRDRLLRLTRADIEIAAAELDAGQARADLAASERRVQRAEAALEAAQHLLVEIVEPGLKQALHRRPIMIPSQELEALLQTRTFRWTRVPRSIYAAIRAGGTKR